MCVTLLPVSALAENAPAEELVLEAVDAEEPVVEEPINEESAPVVLSEVNGPEVEEPVEDSSSAAEDEVIEEPVVKEHIVEEPVRVVFACEPTAAMITVYDAVQTGANGEALVIEAETDGSYLLFPGDYWYDAQSEGFIPVEKQPFTVKAQAPSLEIALILSPIPAQEALIENSSQATSDEVLDFDNNAQGVLPEGTEVSVSGSLDLPFVIVDVDTPQNLLDGYAVQEISSLYPRLPILRAPKNVGNALSGPPAILYTESKTCIRQIADGERESTIFSFSIESLFDNKIIWTQEELGLDKPLYTVNSDGKRIINSTDIINALTDKLDLRSVLTALLQDCPYELYWYDKVVGVQPSWAFNLRLVNNDTAVKFTYTSYKTKFAVASEYQNGGTFVMNTTLGQEVQSAVSNAQAIVSAAASYSLVDKLNYYRQRICDLVSYNDAAAGGGVAYGNPWQLIWVFDNDSSTNVVCEGYAKAFQYLCDLSDIGSATCYTVTGNMAYGTGAGNHMWNIVTMPDGKNYLVDITNCDLGSVGYPDKLFLKGCTGANPTYSCCDVTYTYGYSDTNPSPFTEAELTLSATDYDAGSPCTHPAEQLVIDPAVPATCTATGLTEGSHCGACGDVIVAQQLTEKAPHTPRDPVHEDEEPATCTEAGHYEAVVYCTTCGEELSRETVETPATGHHFSKGVCEICGAYEYAARVMSATLTLEDQVNINFYVSVFDGAAEDYTSVYTLRGVETRKNLAELETDAAGRYRVVVPVVAKEMTEPVSMYLVDKNGETVSNVVDYSVETYCKNKLTSSDAGLRSLCTALLDYGAYTQKLLGYNTENLANRSLHADGMSPEVEAASVPVECYVQQITDKTGTEGITPKSAALVVEAATIIKIRYMLAAGYDIGEYRFECGGKTLQPVKESENADGSSVYHVELRGIAAKRMNEAYTIAVTHNGEGTMAVTYSVLTYAYNKQNVAETGGFAKALYLYHCAAKEFFG